MPNVVTRSVAANPPGTAFCRYVAALVEGRGSVTRSRAFAERWADTPIVARAFDPDVVKAAVAPGDTVTPSWAGALVSSGIADEPLAFMRGASIVGAVAPRLRRVPFGLIVPSDASSVTLGDWVQEGKPTPVAALAFNGVGPLRPTKVAVIVALTRELIMTGSPATQSIVVNSVLGGLAATIDRKFLDPAIAAPVASITNGAILVPSSGSTPAQIAADLAAMLAAITTAGSGLTWIMRKKAMATIAGALGSASGLPATLYGLPVIVSDNSPAQVTLADGAAILLADDDGFDVSISPHAAPQMNTAPDSPPTETTIYLSFFQNDIVGVRPVRWINWLRAVPGAVSYMPATWAA